MGMGGGTPKRPWEFEDGEGEVEVRLKLPEDLAHLSGSEAARKLNVTCTDRSFSILRKDGGPPILSDLAVYEKIRPADLAWYVERGTIVVSLAKQFARKWPALTDEEALEKRFGPIRTSSLPKTGSTGSSSGGGVAAAGGGLAGGDGAAAAGSGGAAAAAAAAAVGGTKVQLDEDAAEGGGAGAAWATRAKVERLLRCAQDGDVAGMRVAAAELVAHEGQEGAAVGDGKEGAAVAAGTTAPSEAAVAAAATPASAGAGAMARSPSAAAVDETLREVRDGNGRSALHFAALRGQLGVCRHLVEEAGMAVDAKDDEGETPLMLAARGNYPEVVVLLLRHGADPSSAADKSGAQAIHHAAGHGSIEVLKLLLDPPPLVTAAPAAAGEDAPSARKGADVNAMSDAGPPLVWACGHGKAAAAELLLGNGADPDLASEDGITPLLTAAAAGETDIVQLLTKHGANVNADGPRGATPLFIAATEGNLPMLDCLLQAGADPNRTDEDGNVPVQAAAYLGQAEVVEKLLPLTARPANLPADTQWTAAALLAANEQEQDGSAARDSGASVQALQHQAAAVEDETEEEVEEWKQKEEGVVAAKERGDHDFKAGRFLDAVTSYTKAIDLLPARAAAAAKQALTSPPAASSDSTLPRRPAGVCKACATTAGAVFSNRSVAWAKQGRAQEALADARAARALRPDWAKACYREGVALQLLGFYEEAANAFFEGVQRDPASTELATAFQQAIAAGKAAHAEKAKQQEQEAAS